MNLDEALANPTPASGLDGPREDLLLRMFESAFADLRDLALVLQWLSGDYPITETLEQEALAIERTLEPLYLDLRVRQPDPEIDALRSEKKGRKGKS